jgi:ketosteroid isomerase-like protein
VIAIPYDKGVTVQARQDTVDLITAYYAAMEANEPSVYGGYYAEDMTLTFGNSPTVKGRENVLASFGVLGQVRSLRHDLLNIWEEDGGQVVIECVGHWRLHDDTTVSIPAMTVFTIAHGKITDQRIFVDNAPLAEALARA